MLQKSQTEKKEDQLKEETTESGETSFRLFDSLHFLKNLSFSRRLAALARLALRFTAAVYSPANASVLGQLLALL